MHVSPNVKNKYILFSGKSGGEKKNHSRYTPASVDASSTGTVVMHSGDVYV